MHFAMLNWLDVLFDKVWDFMFKLLIICPLIFESSVNVQIRLSLLANFWNHIQLFRKCHVWHHLKKRFEIILIHLKFLSFVLRIKIITLIDCIDIILTDAMLGTLIMTFWFPKAFGNRLNSRNLYGELFDNLWLLGSH